jgi:radical SAM protein with 4Fe4S-binding SPASM domain
LKTPLTITAKAWNYCTNQCGYCVSHSASARWRFHGRLEEIPQREILNFDSLVLWLQRYAPAACVHVSGGEPLLRPDIETQIAKLVVAGIPTTITTNGILIEKRPQLLDMPLKWIVTHHEANDFEIWRRNADLIREKPHIACRLITGCVTPENKHEFEYLYAGFNFMWGRLWGLRCTEWNPLQADMPHIASDVLHLIEPDGTIYPCNHSNHPSIGNINSMEYDKVPAIRQDPQCWACIRGGLCQAYQSARLTQTLEIPFEDQTCWPQNERMPRQ